MADISKVTLPNGSTYNIKDTTARSQITSEAATRKAADDSINNTINNLKLNLTGAMHYVGVTTTPLKDGDSWNMSDSTIDKSIDIVYSGDDINTYIPKSGDVVIHGNKEFVFSTHVKTIDGVNKTIGIWNEFGSTGSLKALAFKDSASGSVTPLGTVSKPTFTGTAAVVNLTVDHTDILSGIDLTSKVGTYNTDTSEYSEPNKGPANMQTIVTPTAHVSGGKVTTNPTTATIKQVSAVGTLPTFSATVTNETLSFNFNAGSLPTTTNTSVVTGVTSTLINPTVAVSPFLIAGYPHKDTTINATGTFTPQGTISQPTFTGNASTVTVK